MLSQTRLIETASSASPPGPGLLKEDNVKNKDFEKYVNEVYGTKIS